MVVNSWKCVRYVESARYGYLEIMQIEKQIRDRISTMYDWWRIHSAKTHYAKVYSFHRFEETCKLEEYVNVVLGS